jgi:hypothetical protein
VIVWVQRRAIPEPNTGCWLWLGCPDAAGYGRTTIGGAHRHVWRLYGRAVDGVNHVLHHRCGVRRCVNPAHLDLQDRAAHMQQHRVAKRKPLESHRAQGRRHRAAWLARQAQTGGCRQCLEPAVPNRALCRVHLERARVLRQASRLRKEIGWLTQRIATRHNI